MMTKPITIGTRGSALALTQTNWVKEQLEKLHPKLRFEIKIIKTAGDKRQVEPEYEVDPLFGVIAKEPKTKPRKIKPGADEKGIFTKELESALLLRKIDIAVHSLKDMPVELTPGLELSAIPKRADARDCLITRAETSIDQLPPNALIGTGSPRRMREIQRSRPDLKVEELIGNIDTRLRKLETNPTLHAILLAQAGLERLRPELDQLIVTPIPFEKILPAPGQGALAIQTRANDETLRSITMNMNHAATRLCVETERAFLLGLGGGCRLPLGALAIKEEQTIRFTARLYNEAGHCAPFAEKWPVSESVAQALALGQAARS